MGRAGCRTAALFWCVCFSVVSLARQVCVYAQSRDSTIREVDALAAATDTWLTSIEFYCRFEQYSGTAASWDDALAEKYTKPLQLRCTGEYAVSKDCIRHAVRDPNAPSPSGSRNAATTSAPQKTSGGLKIHDAARNKKSRVRHCSLLTAHCSLLTAHCSLLTAHCSLLTAHCSLLTFCTRLLAQQKRGLGYAACRATLG
ncbi:MAG: hypothetical protein KatS3mg110_3780 [Pirellulaceae bacterium]|nr:MAG: hypothetical protein KatS3mg110_3780 [Pirellulaceae bacterium]